MIILALFGLSLSFSSFGQTPWLPVVNNDAICTNLAGQQLKKYAEMHNVGNICYLLATTITVLNLSDKSNTSSTPFYVAGIIGLVGYVLNDYVAPSYIKNAGIIMSGNMVSIPLDGLRPHHFMKFFKPDDFQY